MSHSGGNDTKVEVEVLYQGSPIPEENYANNSNGQMSGVHPVTESYLPPSYHDIPGVVPLGSGTEHPPTYDEANDPNAPPPTYESLFGRVRQARRESNGFLEFLKKLFILILGTVTCSIIMGITMVIPITNVVIGSMYMYDCRAEPYIPVFLVVSGAFGVIKNLLNFRQQCKVREDEEYIRQDPVSNVVTCFMLAWFVAGCVWVYRVYEPNYERHDSVDYCDKTLYLYTFWLLNSVFIFIGLVMSCLCCVGCLSMGSTESSLSEAQISEIRQTSLARILCDNTDVKEMQPLALLKDTQWNAKVSCDSTTIPKPSLRPWRNEPVWTK
ncbi:hypothetical protein CHUAL_007001 [Chamberlinius hualienensis]